MNPPKDSTGKPIAWLDLYCIKCEAYLCQVMTADVVSTPIVICIQCAKTYGVLESNLTKGE